MSKISRSRFARLAAKAHVVTAACAVAAAVVLSPLPAALAEPAAPVPQASTPGALGGSAAALIDPTCEPIGSPACVAALIPGFDAGGILQNPIFQNPLWWFGAPNPNPPEQTLVFQFYPLALVPGFLQPLFGWFAAINFEACIGGLTLQIGPYGTISGSYGRGCA